MSLPAIGHINFLNCLPLTYSYEHDGFAEGLQIVSAAPAELNAAVIAGRLDISPVSSIVYAENSEKLLILPHVSIMADGDVQSIVLVSRQPIETIAGGRIILSAKSAISHCLLKIIMAKAYGAHPVYETRPVTAEDPLPPDAAASLLIGDDALNLYHHHASSLYCYDIGKEWKNLTGSRMIFAVWVVNRDFAQRSPELVQQVYERITRGFQNGCAKKAQIIESVLDSEPFTRQQLEDYFTVIQWQFGAGEQAALHKFYTLAQEQGLLEKVPEIKLAEVQESC